MSGIQIIIDITLCYQNASDNMLQRIMQAEMRIIYEQKATACQAQRAAQDYVASVLGIARQTYSHYETGKRTPSPDALFKLAGLYNISVDDLMQLTLDVDRDISYDAPAPSQASIDLEGFIEYFSNTNNQKKFQFFSAIEKELYYYFDQLSDDDKEEIIEFIKVKVHRHQKKTGL